MGVCVDCFALLSLLPCVRSGASPCFLDLRAGPDVCSEACLLAYVALLHACRSKLAEVGPEAQVHAMPWFARLGVLDVIDRFSQLSNM